MPGGALDSHETKKKVIEVITTMQAPARHWACYLIDSSDKYPDHLKNKVFSVLLYGLADSNINFKQTHSTLNERCEHHSLTAAAYYIKLYYIVMLEIEKLLCIFSDNELGGMLELRHQLTHGRLRMMHKESRDLFCTEGGRLAKRKVSSDEYFDFLRENSASRGGKRGCCCRSAAHSLLPIQNRLLGYERPHLQRRRRKPINRGHRTRQS
jgi:hypothetical protein